MPTLFGCSVLYSLLTRVTLGLLCSHQASSDFKSAEVLYKEVLEKHPAYTACYLRLAAMAKAEGKRQQAQSPRFVGRVIERHSMS
eukprot:scaffold506270_cov23-Prasinocladus_malaysianus.AAC.1